MTLLLLGLLGLSSARPEPAADLGSRVRKALQSRGISLDKVLASKDEFFTDVGDIWSDCG